MSYVRCPSLSVDYARGNRLSVIPLTEAEFDAIVAAGS